MRPPTLRPIDKRRVTDVPVGIDGGRQGQETSRPPRHGRVPHQLLLNPALRGSSEGGGGARCGPTRQGVEPPSSVLTPANSLLEIDSIDTAGQPLGGLVTSQGWAAPSAGRLIALSPAPGSASSTSTSPRTRICRSGSCITGPTLLRPGISVVHRVRSTAGRGCGYLRRRRRCSLRWRSGRRR